MTPTLLLIGTVAINLSVIIFSYVKYKKAKRRINNYHKSIKDAL